jgi:chondroitin 4-sulfotransferase 11
MVSHEHRCIFVHIPKTAGNSINRVFGVSWQDHKDLQRYFTELGPELFASYFKFAVVRNPWDRLFSDYNYQRKKSRGNNSKLFLFTDRGLKRNFAEWAQTALADPDYYNPAQWGGEVSPTIHRWSPQIDWISVDGKPQVDFIARLEHLSEDFRVVCRRLGLRPERLPHRNRRLHLHYSHYYDRTTRDLVAAYYARDIAQFGYDFERSIFRINFFS